METKASLFPLCSIRTTSNKHSHKLHIPTSYTHRNQASKTCVKLSCIDEQKKDREQSALFSVLQFAHCIRHILQSKHRQRAIFAMITHNSSYVCLLQKINEHPNKWIFIFLLHESKQSQAQLVLFSIRAVVELFFFFLFVVFVFENEIRPENTTPQNEANKHLKMNRFSVAVRKVG